MRIAEAEQIWRKAYDENERINTSRTSQAEQAAWDAYAELCDEAQECLQPGCRVVSPEYAWCVEHRS